MIHFKTVKYGNIKYTYLKYFFYDKEYNSYYTCTDDIFFANRYDYDHTFKKWVLIEHKSIDLSKIISKDIIVEKDVNNRKINIIFSTHNRIYKRMQKINKI